MAVKLNTSNETFSVISRIDSALPDDLTQEEWDAYQLTLDEKLLRMTAEPTRFVLRRSLPFAAQQTIANQQMGIGPNGKPEVKLGYVLEEVRCALVEIRNPVGTEDPLVFKKAADGFADHDLIANLNSAGIAMELFSVRQSRMAGVVVPKK